MRDAGLHTRARYSIPSTRLPEGLKRAKESLVALRPCAGLSLLGETARKLLGAVGHTTETSRGSPFSRIR